jgi:hypothetical protein
MIEMVIEQRRRSLGGSFEVGRSRLRNYLERSFGERPA